MEIVCPYCRTRLRASENHQGKTVGCPKCKKQFVAAPATKDIQEELCSHCRRPIGTSQQACVFQGQILCNECDKKLRSASKAQTDDKAQTPRSRTYPLAIVSLALGIGGVFTIATGLVGAILGGYALDRIDGSAGALKGRGLAIAGMITGAVSPFLLIGLLALKFYNIGEPEAGRSILTHAATGVAVVLAVIIMLRLKLERYRWYKWYSPFMAGILLTPLLQWVGFVPKDHTGYMFTVLVVTWLAIAGTLLLSAWEDYKSSP